MSWKRDETWFLCSLETWYDYPVRHRGDIPLTRLGDVPPRRRSVFHLRHTCDITKAYRETLLPQRHDDLLPDEGVSVY